MIDKLLEWLEVEYQADELLIQLDGATTDDEMLTLAHRIRARREAAGFLKSYIEELQK